MHEHILIIRPGGLGDTLLTFPILRVLQARDSQPHVTFVSNAMVLPLARAFGLANQTFDYGLREWSELFSASGIRASALQDLLRHTNHAICWLRDPDGIIEQNVRLAGVQHITVAPGRPPEGSDIHIVDYLAHTLGMSGDTTVLATPLASISRNATISRRIAIHPGSGGMHKCWPVSRFAAVIIELWKQRVPILLLAGPADEERLATLREQIAAPTAPTAPPDPSLLTVLVNAPLLRIAEELQHCCGYLGNDSGITHLAALLGIPTIALFGPSDPNMWRPIGPCVHVLYEPTLDIQVDMVMSTIAKL